MLFLLLLVMSCKSTESKSSLTLYRAALNYEMNDLKFNKIFIESDEDVNKKILESSLVKKGFEIAKDMWEAGAIAKVISDKDNVKISFNITTKGPATRCVIKSSISSTKGEDLSIQVEKMLDYILENREISEKN